MTSRQQELVNRILASRQFAHTESLRKILLYLCQDVKGDEGPTLKESRIAIGALGRPDDFDPKIDPIVRVSIAAIRDRLRSYFESEGAEETLRLSIPKGYYRAVFAEAGPALPARAAPARAAVRRFWSPHLAGARPNVLICGELLFFRDEEGNFFRNIYVNDLRTGLSDLQKRIPRIDAAALRPSYHFFSAGEVHCMISLTRLFHELGAPLDTRNSRLCSWHELRESNVVLIGSSRVNKFVGPLQSDDCFAVLPDHIENRCPQKNEQERYQGRRYMEGQLERLVEYAVITRRPGVAPGSFVTILGGNHGRVMEAAATFLTLEEKVRDLFNRMRLEPSEPLPSHFQVLLLVNMIDFDEEIVSVEYLTHRVLAR
jgi:hypothetical protein